MLEKYDFKVSLSCSARKKRVETGDLLERQNAPFHIASVELPKGAHVKRSRMPLTLILVRRRFGCFSVSCLRLFIYCFFPKLQLFDCA